MSASFNALLRENEPTEQPVEELDFKSMGMGQQREHIRSSFYKWWGANYGEYQYPYCQEVYLDHPTLGNSVIVSWKASTYAAPYTISTDGEVSFTDRSSWRAVMETYVFVDEPTEPAPMAASEAEITQKLEAFLASEEKELSLGYSIMENQEVIFVTRTWDRIAAKRDLESRKSKAEPVSEALAEHFDGAILEVSEASAKGDKEDEPVKMKIKLIEPGWGNKRDNHYYSREMLEAAAPKFVGAKMYTTDHKPDEKNVMTEVATILRHDGFTESGAPVMEVGIHDPYFARSVRNRQKLGTLNQLENSILATGSVRQGEVAGKPGKIVEAINEVKSVDFVTRAGAGGHALALAESEEGAMPQEKETPEVTTTTAAEAAPTTATIAEAQPALLSEAEVTNLLKEDAGLPEASRERLAKGQYATKDALAEAIVTEKAYVKALTGSGRPAGLGESAAAPQHQSLPIAERHQELDAIKYGRGGR